MQLNKMTLAHNFMDKDRTKDVKISKDVTFEMMLLASNTLHGLQKSGFYRPSPVQLLGIPLGKCGFDLLLEAKSGTGKTAVFSIIALEKINIKNGVQVIILTPTREIAAQVCDVLREIGSSYNDLLVEVVMGGLPVQDDIKKFSESKPHIVVGSPGRLKHLIADKHIDVSTVRLLVLDEADKLMEKSFLPDIKYIHSILPKQKQVIMSSATYPESSKEFISQFVCNAQHICPNTNSVLLGVVQKVTYVKYNINIIKQTQFRFKELTKILTKIPFKQCLIFCNYQARVAELHKMLLREKWPAEQLHGQQDQTDRLDALKTLQEYKCRILISTDLASRGIDASNIDLVINFEPPFEWQTYLHRIGRAGRFGSYGTSITILSEGTERKKFIDLVKSLNGPINLCRLWDDDSTHSDNDFHESQHSATMVCNPNENNTISKPYCPDENGNVSVESSSVKIKNCDGNIDFDQIGSTVAESLIDTSDSSQNVSNNIFNKDRSKKLEVSLYENQLSEQDPRFLKDAFKNFFVTDTLPLNLESSLKQNMKIESFNEFLYSCQNQDNILVEKESEDKNQKIPGISESENRQCDNLMSEVSNSKNNVYKSLKLHKNQVTETDSEIEDLEMANKSVFDFAISELFSTCFVPSLDNAKIESFNELLESLETYEITLDNADDEYKYLHMSKIPVFKNKFKEQNLKSNQKLNDLSSASYCKNSFESYSELQQTHKYLDEDNESKGIKQTHIIDKHGTDGYGYDEGYIDNSELLKLGLPTAFGSAKDKNRINKSPKKVCNKKYDHEPIKPFIHKPNSADSRITVGDKSRSHQKEEKGDSDYSYGKRDKVSNTDPHNKTQHRLPKKNLKKSENCPHSINYGNSYYNHWYRQLKLRVKQIEMSIYMDELSRM